MPFFSIGMVRWQARGDIYSVENAPVQELALVLGAAAYGDRLSDILKDRVDTAIELYFSNKVKVLVMSGGANEARAMKAYALTQGVPAQDIVEDSEGLNTLASVENLEGPGKALVIVSQEYHLPRALYIAKKMDWEAIGVESDKREYIKMQDFKRRERLATSWIVFYLLLLER